MSDSWMLSVRLVAGLPPNFQSLSNRPSLSPQTGLIDAVGRSLSAVWYKVAHSKTGLALTGEPVTGTLHNNVAPGSAEARPDFRFLLVRLGLPGSATLALTYASQPKIAVSTLPPPPSFMTLNRPNETYLQPLVAG